MTYQESVFEDESEEILGGADDPVFDEPADILPAEDDNDDRFTNDSLASSASRDGVEGQDHSSKMARTLRIRTNTADGGFQGTKLPEGFLDHQDWLSIDSPDPFSRLFLDWRQHQSINDNIVNIHSQLLRTFWDEQVRRIDTASVGERDALVTRYGGNVARIRGYSSEIKSAGERLATLERRTAVAENVSREKLQEMRQLIQRSLADGELTVGEARMLFDKDGPLLDLLPQEIGPLLKAELDRLGFVPAVMPGTPVPDKPYSVPWMDVQTFGEWRALRETAVASKMGTPINFKSKGGSASTLAELVSLCDREWDEAMDALSSDGVAIWASQRGNMPLVQAAKATQKTLKSKEGDARNQAVEKFVRIVAQEATTWEGAPFNFPMIRVGEPIIDIGTLPQGASKAVSIKIERVGPRRVWGKVEIDGDTPGVSFTDSFATTDSTIVLQLDMLNVAPGTYGGLITIRPDDADPVTLPLKYSVAAVRISADPSAFALGALHFGKKITLPLAIRVEPEEGRIEGAVAVLPERAGMRVFGRLQDLQLEIDTGQFQAGTNHAANIQFETTAGPLTVPVTFNVTIDWTTVGICALSFALATGLLLGWVRYLMVQNYGATGWTGSPEGLEAWPIYLLLIGIVAALGFSAKRLAKGASQVLPTEQADHG